MHHIVINRAYNITHSRIIKQINHDNILNGKITITPPNRENVYGLEFSEKYDVYYITFRIFKNTSFFTRLLDRNHKYILISDEIYQYIKLCTI